MASFTLNAISIRKKLLLGVLTTAVFLILEFLIFYIFSQDLLTYFTKVHQTQRLSVEVLRLRQLNDAIRDLIAETGVMPRRPDLEQIYTQIFDQFSKNLEQLKTDPLKNQELLITKDFEDTQNALQTMDREIRNFLLTLSRRTNTSPSQTDVKQRLMIIRQLGLDLTDTLIKTNLALDKNIETIFSFAYSRRFRPLISSFFLTSVFILLSFTIGLAIIRGINRSISNLLQSTKALSHGDLSFRAPVISQDELGALTDSFNEMINSLQQMTISKNYVENIIQSIPDPVFVLDTRGLITSTNQVTIQTFEYAPHELLRHPVDLLFWDKSQSKIKEALLNGENKNIELSLCSKNNRQITVALSASRLRETPESEPGIVCIAKDITEQKHMMSELERQRDQQKATVQQLAESNVALCAANKELETFSYSVSHDLRAPLRSIDGFSKALLEDHSSRLDLAGIEYLNRIIAAIKKMGVLIDSLLNLSRIARKQLTMRKTNLSQIAISVANEHQRQEPHRKVKFVIADNIIAYCDPELVRVIIENLIDNSWKFTSKHQAALIQLGVIKNEKEQIFYIRDDGAGFDMGHINKLFGAFQRLHSASEFPGTGVGLATVQRIIHRHGGRIWAESQVEQGATFYFTLSSSKEQQAAQNT